MTNYSCSPAPELEAEFRKIYEVRMKGLPICNNRLQVRALGFQSYLGHWVGTVVTPWSILVVMTCGDPRRWPKIREGRIMTVNLPAGSFSFLGMNSMHFGSVLSCSLMSPIDPLYDQHAAEKFALKALSLMLTPSTDTPGKQNCGRDVPEKLTRRDFFKTIKEEVT